MLGKWCWEDWILWLNNSCINLLSIMVYQKPKHVKRKYHLNTHSLILTLSSWSRCVCVTARQWWKDLYVWFLPIRSTWTWFRYWYSTSRSETCRTRRVSYFVWRNVESDRRSSRSYRKLSPLFSSPSLSLLYWFGMEESNSYSRYRKLSSQLLNVRFQASI